MPKKKTESKKLTEQEAARLDKITENMGTASIVPKVDESKIFNFKIEDEFLQEIYLKETKPIMEAGEALQALYVAKDIPNELRVTLEAALRGANSYDEGICLAIKNLLATNNYYKEIGKNYKEYGRKWDYDFSKAEKLIEVLEVLSSKLN